MDAYHGILCSCQKQWIRLYTALRIEPRNRVDKQKKSKNQIIWDFPGGPVVKTMLSGFPGSSVGKKNPAANSGGASSIPDPERSHVPQSNSAPAPQLLSDCSGARKHNYGALVPQLLKPTHPGVHALQHEKPSQWQACTPQLESSPRSPQLEKSPHSNKDPLQP